MLKYIRTNTIRPLRAGGIIHLFAVLHAVVALLCQLGGINDELVLTLLTIVMILLICIKRGVNVEFTVASIIVGNVLGFLLGTGGAALFALIFKLPSVTHAVSTLVTTEILGWSIVWFTMLFHRKGSDETSLRQTDRWNPQIGWLLLAVGVIFMLRLGYVQLFTSASFSSGRVYAIIDLLMTNSAALIFLLGVNIIYVRIMRRHKTGHGPAAEIAAFVFFILAASGCGTFIAGYKLPLEFDRTFTGLEFFQLWIVTLLIEVTLFSVIFMVDYALTARAGLRMERGKTHQAQFRYMKLKQQVNPHFLFNSLNILDCLVCEERTEQASTYIHKLAGIYRYMLQNEEEPVVRLRDEMAFVDMYVDLLKVRFPEGFRLETSISNEAMNRFVVPCSVQLLIENAIKHNSVDPQRPLLIRVEVHEGRLTVSNNLQLKVSETPSTRVGLNYIRQQYLDLSGLQIEIVQTAAEYNVTLPLL